MFQPGHSSVSAMDVTVGRFPENSQTGKSSCLSPPLEHYYTRKTQENSLLKKTAGPKNEPSSVHANAMGESGKPPPVGRLRRTGRHRIPFLKTEKEATYQTKRNEMGGMGRQPFWGFKVYRIHHVFGDVGQEPIPRKTFPLIERAEPFSTLFFRERKL